MENKVLIVAEEDIKTRLDVFVCKHDSNLSRSRVQKLISDGMILVNGANVKSNYSVSLDDEVSIEIPANQELDLTPIKMDLDIIYQDSDLLVINKPRGLVVHPGAGVYDKTLVHGLLYEIKDLSGINGVNRPGIVHRIDKDTSGLLLVAKNDKAHIYLSKLLEDHKIKRTYLALVEGIINHDSGIVDAPIGRDERDRKRMAVTSKNSKPAITNFKVIQRFNKYTLIECQLETGRTHQIRVHMNYIGHPIVGDPKYGRRKTMDTNGQLLHAYKLEFTLPSDKSLKQLEVELPKYFKDVLEKVENEEN